MRGYSESGEGLYQARSFFETLKGSAIIHQTSDQNLSTRSVPVAVRAIDFDIQTEFPTVKTNSSIDLAKQSSVE